jgi:alpha-amylase
MGAFGRWYDLYQPTHFTIGNYLGTEEEFRALTREAAAHGIFIIVDAIPNHTTAYWAMIDPALRDHEPSLFHSRRGETRQDNVWATRMDFNNRRSFVRGNLLGLWDFYTGRPEFQELYMAFLGEIIDAGASGFRFDAAHHIELPNDPPDIASDFWPVISSFVDNRIRELGRVPFQYGEVLGSGDRANHYLHGLFEHANYRVTPYAFSRYIMSAVDVGFLHDGQNGWNTTNYHIHGNPPDQRESVFGPAFRGPDLGGHEGFSDGVVPWVESHDLYGNEGLSRHLTDAQIIVGWALITARKGTSPLFFVRPGPDFVNDGTMFVPQEDGSFANIRGHQLLYRHPAVAAINWFANDFIHMPEATDTYGTVALIQRGPAGAKTGAVLANVDENPVPVLFPVEMVDGVYTCRVSDGVYSVLEGWLSGPDIGGRGVIVLRGDSDAVPPDIPPFVGVYPYTTDGYFSDPEGFTLTLIGKGTQEQFMRIMMNDTLLVDNAPFFRGETILLGISAEIGDVFTVSLTGTDESGAIVTRAERRITMREERGPYRIRVEYVRDENPWPRAGIWAWNARGDVFDHGWPGPEMEWLPRTDGEGYAWVFYLPEDTVVPVTLIFNNFGAGEQTEPYLTITGSTRVFQMGDGVLIGNEEPISE